MNQKGRLAPGAAALASALGVAVALLLGAGVVAAASGCLIFGGAGGPRSRGGGGASMEEEIDRPGADYEAFDLDAPRPALCRDACVGDPRCAAYSYARPGAAGPKPRCRLKTAMPNAVTDRCCISGIKAFPH
jgi:hypothetical protein